MLGYSLQLLSIARPEVRFLKSGFGMHQRKDIVTDLLHTANSLRFIKYYFHICS
jgi:hypothetical protein